MPVFRRSTNECLIDFDWSTLTHISATPIVGAKREADAMQHEPRRFLSDLEVAGNLVAADAVFAIHDEPDGSKPFVERDRRILEYGAALHAELLVAIFVHA